MEQLEVQEEAFAETLGERVIRLGRERTEVKARMRALSAELAEAVRQGINEGKYNESSAARAAGVDRMTVRSWIGK
jgi:ABC-type amino acid transport system permease subunit